MTNRPAMKTALAILLCTAFGPVLEATAGPAVPLKEAKLNIEHNATDLDTGFQGAIDSEGWKSLEVRGPEGVILEFETEGKLRSLGMTELFFETVEPENAVVPLPQMLSKLPEGNYRIYGPATAGGATSGTAWLTHDIPAGPVLLAPPEGAVVPAADLLVRWRPVTKTITGEPVAIIAYQLIIEKDGPPHPHMIGKPNSLSMYLPATVTRIRIPGAFLEPDTDYLWEVLAIERSGNQTLSSSQFATN